MVIHESTNLRVLALGIFADNDHVDVATLAVRQRRRDAFIENGGTDISILVERAPDRKQQSIERHVIGDIRMADGA